MVNSQTYANSIDRMLTPLLENIIELAFEYHGELGFVVDHATDVPGIPTQGAPKGYCARNVRCAYGARPLVIRETWAEVELELAEPPELSVSLADKVVFRRNIANGRTEVLRAGAWIRQIIDVHADVQRHAMHAEFKKEFEKFCARHQNIGVLDD